jgi:ribonuclease P protein component
MEEKLLPAEEAGAEKNLPFQTKGSLNSTPSNLLFANFDLTRLKDKKTFGRYEKLKSTKTIELLFNKGKSVSHNGFTLVYLFTPLTTHYPAQAAFSVPKKCFKHAVDRNRVKRLMREAYRLNKFMLYQKLVDAKTQMALMWVYKGRELPEYEKVLQSMTYCLGKLQVK